VLITQILPSSKARPYNINELILQICCGVDFVIILEYEIFSNTFLRKTVDLRPFYNIRISGTCPTVFTMANQTLMRCWEWRARHISITLICIGRTDRVLATPEQNVLGNEIVDILWWGWRDVPSSARLTNARPTLSLGSKLK
jgi:hypothetical protein